MLLGPTFENDDDGLGAEPATAPAAHVLGGPAAGAPATVAAASAALRRAGNSISPQQRLPSISGPVASAAAASAPADAMLDVDAEATSVSSIEGLGHRDAATEAAEAAMASLGAGPARGSHADSASSPEGDTAHEGGDGGRSAADALPAAVAKSSERSVAPAGSGSGGALRPAASPAAVASSLTSDLRIQPAAQCSGLPSGNESSNDSAARQPAGSCGAAGSAAAMDCGSPCSAALDAEPGLPPPAAAPASAASAAVAPESDTAAAAAEDEHTKNMLRPAASMHSPAQPGRAAECSDGGEVQRRLARVQQALAALTATADPAQTRVALYSLQKILQVCCKSPLPPRLRIVSRPADFAALLNDVSFSASAIS